jgi:hypothetical protein
MNVHAMTIHPVQDQQAQVAPYDTVWGRGEVPVQEHTGIERVMLADDKIWVVLAVVLVIWIGFVFFLQRTDRKIDRLERKLEESISKDEVLDF